MRGLSIGLVFVSLLVVTLQLACAPNSAESPNTVKIALVYSFGSSDRAVSEESVQTARRLVGDRSEMGNCRVELVISDTWEWDRGRRARSIAADSATMIVLGHGSESDLDIAGVVYDAANLPWISFARVEEMPPSKDQVWFAAADSSTATPVHSALVDTVVSISLDAIEGVCEGGEPSRQGVSRRLAELAGQRPATFRAVAR